MPAEVVERFGAEAEVFPWNRREPELARLMEIEAEEDMLAATGELLWKEQDLLPDTKSGAVAAKVNILLAELLLIIGGL